MASTEWRLIGGARTPFGRGNGHLRKIPPFTMVRLVCEETLSRLELDPRSLSASVLACGMPDFFPPYAARALARSLGLRNDARSLLLSEGEIAPLLFLDAAGPLQGCVLLAGGDSTSFAMGEKIKGASFLDRIGFEPDSSRSLAEEVEAVAAQYGFTREELDDTALESHEKFEKGAKREAASRCIIPVLSPPDYEEFIRHDQKLRDSPSRAMFNSFPTIHGRPGSVGTFASISMPADGAACCVLAPERPGKNGAETAFEEMAGGCGSFRLNAKIAAAKVCGAPAEGSSAAYAVHRLLEETGVPLDSLQELDIHERSAAHLLSACRDLGEKAPEKLNRGGGALVLGNVPGASFMRQLIHLALRLKPGNKGVCAMEAGGLCGAVLVEGRKA